MSVYLDICAIQRPLDDHSQMRIATETEAILGILDLCEQGKLILLRSAAHKIENDQNPHPDRKDHTETVLSLASHYLPTTEPVTERANAYVKAGLKELDALHLAIAVEGGASFFCTVDDQLLRRGRKIDTNETNVLSPLEMIRHLDPARGTL